MGVDELKCREILAAILNAHQMGPKDFFGTSLLKHIVEARIEAIRTMKSSTKATHATIALVMQRESSIIRYHLSEQNRLRRKKYYAGRWRRLRAASANTEHPAPTAAQPLPA